MKYIRIDGYSGPGSSKCEVRLPLSLLQLHLAGMALQGMLASCPDITDRTKVNKAKWCGVAYDWADALLAECARREGE